jgi:hypothetical protein
VVSGTLEPIKQEQGRSAGMSDPWCCLSGGHCTPTLSLIFDWWMDDHPEWVTVLSWRREQGLDAMDGVIGQMHGVFLLRILFEGETQK